jgi:DNA polymerase I-like protein with 3'-5' exonuclease and polymerase domains
MLLEHLIDENLDHDLGSMASRYFNDPYKSEFWGKYDNFADATQDEADSYERKDVRYTFDLGVRFLGELKDRMKLVEHVHKLYWCLHDVEVEGIRIDTELLTKTKTEMSAEIEGMLLKLREEFNEYCNVWEIKKWGKEIEKRVSDKGKSRVVRPVFSFTSDSQVGELLYDSSLLGIKPTSKTKKGSPSTSYDTLKEIADLDPRVQSIVDFKGAKAVYSTFVKGLSERIESGRVYPHFSVNGTNTGRLSSSNPNFQNMPQDGVIRNFILPDPGCLIIGADFESLEVGVELNLTDDPALLKIFSDGVSKHDLTAEGVGMSRKDAKTLNFLCQYGGGVWKIKDTFKVSESTAQEIYDKYWMTYKGVMDYKKRVFKELADTNQVVNCFGRVRHFEKPKNKWEKEKQERQAYSHMVQGPGAEMTNYATYEVAELLKQHNMGRLMFAVHDEIVCSVKENMADLGKSGLVDMMQNANDVLGFKYRIKAKAYGPFEFWRKA